MIFETATNVYEAERVIGEGGAGTVYGVVDPEGTRYALKRLRAPDRLKRKRFKNELSFCEERQHDNIVRILDSGTSSDDGKSLPFYVMPLYGGTLRELIEKGIEPDRVLPLFDQILSGVEAAHLKGVFHRDLKPENILADSIASRIMIADFGIAHFEEDDLLTAVETKDQERLANFTYAAPEQRVRRQTVDHRADIFALGLILNEMFTKFASSAPGHPTISSVAPQYAYLDNLAERMILHSPGERPQTIRAVKEEILRRGNEFVALQRLDAARNAVVPAFAPDDPLQGRDVRLTGHFDYDPGAQMLEVGVDPVPPPTWWIVLQQLREFRSVASAYPGNVRFAQGIARIHSHPQHADQVLKLFKEWVTAANANYKRKLAEDARKKDAENRQRLAQEQRQAEERARVLERVRKAAEG
jgi:serine/threonine protein kinase